MRHRRTSHSWCLTRTVTIGLLLCTLGNVGGRLLVVTPDWPLALSDFLLNPAVLYTFGKLCKEIEAQVTVSETKTNKNTFKNNVKIKNIKRHTFHFVPCINTHTFILWSANSKVPHTVKNDIWPPLDLKCTIWFKLVKIGLHKSTAALTLKQTLQTAHSRCDCPLCSSVSE